jgi:hypothetical protein
MPGVIRFLGYAPYQVPANFGDWLNQVRTSSGHSEETVGDRRKPSLLGDIQPDHWLAEYTTELINVLNVLGMLVDLEPAQAKLLEEICVGPTISSSDIRAACVLETPPKAKSKSRKPKGPVLF